MAASSLASCWALLTATELRDVADPDGVDPDGVDPEVGWLVAVLPPLFAVLLSSWASAVSADARLDWSVDTSFSAVSATWSAVVHAVLLPPEPAVPDGAVVLVVDVVEVVVVVVPDPVSTHAVAAAWVSAWAFWMATSALCWALITACWACASPLEPPGDTAAVEDRGLRAAHRSDGLRVGELPELACWPASFSVRAALSESRVVWATVTASCNEVASSVASVCPAVTCWPRLTATEVTVPATWKLAVSSWAGSAVPDTVRVWLAAAGGSRRGVVALGARTQRLGTRRCPRRGRRRARRFRPRSAGIGDGGA